MKSRVLKLIFLSPLIILGIALFVFLGGEVVKLLWNWLLPPLFGWPSITFWQALGLLALTRILFGGWSSHGGRGRWRRRMEERCENMSPEERERLRQRMRERWGWDPKPPSGEPKQS